MDADLDVDATYIFPSDDDAYEWLPNALAETLGSVMIVRSNEE